MDIDRVQVNTSELIPTAPHPHRKETAAAGNSAADSFRRRKESAAGAQAEGGEDENFTTDYHLVIQTSKEGFNSGRRYVHRLPDKDGAYGWLSELQDLVSKAKKRAEEASILAEHEYGTLGYWRVKTMRMYDSRPVQYAIAILIVVAFALDLGEAQVRRDIVCWRQRETRARDFGEAQAVVVVCER